MENTNELKTTRRLREPSRIPMNGRITACVAGAVINPAGPFGPLEERMVVGMIEPKKEHSYDDLWGCWRCGRNLFGPGASVSVVRHPERPDCILFECSGDHE